MSERLSKFLYKNINKSSNVLTCSVRKHMSNQADSQHKDSRRLVIECKRKFYNHYNNQVYNKLEEIPLASKGWNHSKSRGDSFTVHGNRLDFDHPKISLDELNVHANLIKTLKEEGISKATSLQSEVIPVLQSKKHVLLAAETGCGKTLAYLLPVIQNVLNMDRYEVNTPAALILTPNRELALQIGAVANTLAESVGLRVKVIVGGHTKRLMMNPTFEDIDILVATPGAVGKLSTVGIYKLNRVAFTVLDEADTLLDDSFADRMISLLKRVSQSQITLVSATLPKKIPEFLEFIQPNLIRIKSARLHKPLLNITQKFLRLSLSGRQSYLLQIAKQAKAPLLVFTNRNETCNWLSMFLRENGLNCANINGDMKYDIRIQQWNDFCKGFANILSATDVGSRGLDTTQVKQILNYDFPIYPADYIHRIGRIGRLGSFQDSKVTNFICGNQDVGLVQQIEAAIRTNTEIQNVDGNITKLVQQKILKRKRETG